MNATVSMGNSRRTGSKACAKSYGSIKRFETTGMISLLSLTKIAMALDMADELRDIFTSMPYRDIQEVINETRSQSKRRDRFRWEFMELY